MTFSTLTFSTQPADSEDGTGTLYAESPRMRLLRYTRTLCGFDKVFLEPGQRRIVKVPVRLRTMGPRQVARHVLGRPDRDEGAGGLPTWSTPGHNMMHLLHLLQTQKVRVDNVVLGCRLQYQNEDTALATHGRVFFVLVFLGVSRPEMCAHRSCAHR